MQPLAATTPVKKKKKRRKEISPAKKRNGGFNLKRTGVPGKPGHKVPKSFHIFHDKVYGIRRRKGCKGGGATCSWYYFDREEIALEF